MQDLLNPELHIDEVLRRWPQAIPVFTKYRMGCVGCTMAAFETLGSAAQIYHLQLERFLEDLRQAIQSAEE